MGIGFAHFYPERQPNLIRDLGVVSPLRGNTDASIVKAAMVELSNTEDEDHAPYNGEKELKRFSP